LTPQPLTRLRAAVGHTTDTSDGVEQTGAAAAILSSTAAVFHFIAPPPEMPVKPMRLPSTSGRVFR
jgi:hypothetical protein